MEKVVGEKRKAPIKKIFAQEPPKYTTQTLNGKYQTSELYNVISI